MQPTRWGSQVCQQQWCSLLVTQHPCCRHMLPARHLRQQVQQYSRVVQAQGQDQVATVCWEPLLLLWLQACPLPPVLLQQVS